MEYPDYYATLGVARTASPKEIRAAYRALARQHHPDVNPGDPEAEERFKQINEAYEVLSDPEKRRQYDEVGSQWREYERRRGADAAGGRSAPFDWASFGDFGGGGRRYEYRSTSEEDLRDLYGDSSPFSDFFESVFGQARGGGGERQRRASPRGGPDLESRIEIDLSDAYRGAERRITVQSESGTRELEVRIPPGVMDGQRIRLAGQGAPGTAGGPPGDLYLVVAIRPDPRFERRDGDLLTRVRAPYTTLILGGEARGPTPDGKTLALTIPPGTQDGRVFRLRNRGMPLPGRTSRRGAPPA